MDTGWMHLHSPSASIATSSELHAGPAIKGEGMGFCSQTCSQVVNSLTRAFSSNVYLNSHVPLSRDGPCCFLSTLSSMENFATSRDNGLKQQVNT